MTIQPAAAAIATAKFTLNGIKTFVGRDGYGLNANILKDGKKVGVVLDDARGGEVDIDFKDRNIEAEFMAFTAAWYNANGEREKSIAEFAEMGSSVTPENYTPSAKDMAETWINNFVDSAAQEKWMKAQAKKKTLFRLKGDKPGEWRNVGEVSEKAVAFIRNKYGATVEVIYGQPA